jgi:hypothetical protein
VQVCFFRVKVSLLGLRLQSINIRTMKKMRVRLWKRRNPNIKSIARENIATSEKNLRKVRKVPYLLSLARKMIMDLIKQHR